MGGSCRNVVSAGGYPNSSCSGFRSVCAVWADTGTEPGRSVVPQQPDPVTEIARRDQLVASAIQLIAEQGHARASLSRIAKRAGVSKAAVLYHFKTKDDLLDAVLARV